MPSNYDVNLPDWYHSWMKAFEWLQFDWTRLFLPDVCLGSFYNRMLLTSAAPLALASVGLLLWTAVFVAIRRYWPGFMRPHRDMRLHVHARIRFCTETPG